MLQDCQALQVCCPPSFQKQNRRFATGTCSFNNIWAGLQWGAVQITIVPKEECLIVTTRSSPQFVACFLAQMQAYY